ncbi:MAG: hypothetical protein D5R99_00945 [Methanocalculus sp. MSAO_Arc1]|nr:MAG: hypothetical protein D5R99_00945 [Methanocalculus sp. MSAO_Arc1]
MPEEINRIVTDHVSDLLFCPTETAVANLTAVGSTAGVHLVGDVMVGALREHLLRAGAAATILARLGIPTAAFSASSASDPSDSSDQSDSCDSSDVSGSYYLATVHRASNTDHKEKREPRSDHGSVCRTRSAGHLPGPSPDEEVSCRVRDRP